MRLLSSASILVLALAACSSGGGGASGNAGINPGTSSSTRSATGLPFASEARADEEPDGTFTITVVRAQTNYPSEQTRLIVSKERLGIRQDDNTISITIGNETIDLAFDSETDDFAGALANGQDAYFYIYDDGEYASLASIYSYIGEQASGVDFEAFSVVGYETRPNDLPGSGSQLYLASGGGYGNLIETDGSVYAREVDFTSNLDLNVDFGTSRVTGTLFVSLDPSETDASVVLALQRADLIGNGFGTTATCVSGCSSSASVVGGALYGPAYEEMAGLIGLDITEDAEGPLRFVGAGGFIGYRRPE